MANADFEDRFFLGPDEDPDRYEVIEQVGGGGEGTVSKARFALEGTWQVVAVKTLDAPDAAHIDVASGRLHTQVDLLRLLSDPGIVGVHDGFVGPIAHRRGQSAGRPRTLHLVMNWVEGRNLVKWRDELSGPGAFHDIAKILQQIATSLDHLADGRDTNGQSVVHGDLKPGNVIVTTAGQARLVDFGLARLAHAATVAPAGGTKGYLAPEVAASGRFSPASDRYSLGGVAYYLVTGEDPPEHYDLDVIHARLQAAPVLAGRPALADHIVDMLAADPAARPAPAVSWARQFTLTSTTIDPTVGAAGAAPGTPGSPTPPAGTSPALRRGPLLAGAAAAVALVLLATVAAVALTRGTEPDASPPTTLAAASAPDDAGPTTTGAPVRPTTSTRAASPSSTRSAPASSASTGPPAGGTAYDEQQLTLKMPQCPGHLYLDVNEPRVRTDSYRGSDLRYGCDKLTPYNDSSISIVDDRNVSYEGCEEALRTSALSSDSFAPPVGRTLCIKSSLAIDKDLGAFQAMARVVVESVSQVDKVLTLTVTGWRVPG